MRHRRPRLLFVQYGDFMEAYIRLKAGGPETYRDQRKSVEYVESLSGDFDITVLSICNYAYSQFITENINSIGCLNTQLNDSYISNLFDIDNPKLFVLRTPHLGFLKEAARRGVKTLPNFADIFARNRIRDIYYNYRLSSVLSNKAFTCFSNHSLNASKSMIDILGLPQEMIVPWDWSKLPVGQDSKQLNKERSAFSVFFAGIISADKGIEECLRSIPILRREGVDLHFSFAGPGEIQRWRSLAGQLGVENHVNFLGTIPHDDVRLQMRIHDAVVVPSRHSYAEGLPNTIYEALASRSPLIISDHPAFAGRLEVGLECLMFSAGNPVDLAAKILDLVRSPSLYGRLSYNSAEAHEKLYVGIEWQQLIGKFLNDPSNAEKWVQECSLLTLL